MLEHSVLIHVPLSDDELGSPSDDERVEDIETLMREALSAELVGTLDGHEFNKYMTRAHVRVDAK